ADDAFEASDYERVRETWRGLLQDSGVRWETALRRGFIEGVSEGEAEATPPRRPRVHPTHNREFELLLRPHPYVDEAGANNPWLLELPEPITKVCWGNALWMNADDAAAAGLTDGAHAKVRFAGDKSVDLPVLAVTGMPPGTLLAHTGLGRRGVGQVGSGVGTALTPSNGQWNFAVTLEPAEGRTELARTQYHFGMEGHNFVQVRSGPTPPRHAKAHGTAPPSLYGDAPSELADGPYAWAMSIDLSSCIGCQACMVACQAENNIPAVGPEQVRLGREMYWIRVDAYQASQDSESAARLSQPVTCMHCEKAPCEPVCPVAATVHTSTGLNAMVYNRCIGTRYCSNNCPYKVRRFNFLDYRTASDELPQLQHNPNVTVRERGVMEKCTYCIQRISRARTDARRETRPLRANEVQTACQQVCPTDAIVFGDLNHPESDVGHRHALSETYSLLEELDVRPRTRYLPRWTNPAEPAAHDA
ncbi:MAG: 4Fe-4S dicluster domain-containing protein, partial [Opitutales bacterium]